MLHISIKEIFIIITGPTQHVACILFALETYGILVIIIIFSLILFGYYYFLLLLLLLKLFIAEGEKSVTP